MNNMFDIRVEGRKFRTFEGDLYLTIINFGKEVNLPLRERTKKRIEKLNPEKKEIDGYVVITDPKAVLLAAKDLGMLKKVRTIVAAGAATVTLSAGLLSYLNSSNASQINNNDNNAIETTEETEKETKIIKDDDYYLSLAHGEIPTFEEKTEEPIETLDISYEHEVPDYKPIEVNEETAAIEAPIIDSSSDIFDDYYYVYENTRNEAPFSEKETVKAQFGDTIAKYASDYGIDSELYLSLICQENGLNLNEEEIKEYRIKAGTYDGEIHAVGIAQISKSNNGGTIYCYNRNTNQMDVEVIDIERCANDPDYCIKIGAMALSDSINCAIRNKNPMRSNEEAMIYGIVGYFKGPDIAIALSKNNKSFEQNQLYIKENCDDYVNRVLRTVNDGKGISYTTPENKKICIVIDNVNNNTYDYNYDTNAKKLR